MHVVGRDDIDDVDGRVHHQLAPVRRPAPRTAAHRRLAGERLVRLGNHLKDGHRGLRPEHPWLGGVHQRVCVSHPPDATDLPNTNFFHSRVLFVKPSGGRA